MHWKHSAHVASLPSCSFSKRLTSVCISASAKQKCVNLQMEEHRSVHWRSGWGSAPGAPGQLHEGSEDLLLAQVAVAVEVLPDRRLQAASSTCAHKSWPIMWHRVTCMEPYTCSTSCKKPRGLVRNRRVLLPHFTGKHTSSQEAEQKAPDQETQEMISCSPATSQYDSCKGLKDPTLGFTSTSQWL